VSSKDYKVEPPYHTEKSSMLLRIKWGDGPSRTGRTSSAVTPLSEKSRDWAGWVVANKETTSLLLSLSYFGKLFVEFGAVRTRSEELDDHRLKHLNGLYSKIYTGLPYITFVAGRSREAIAAELEHHLGIAPAQRPLDTANGDLDRPAVDSDEIDRMVVPRLSEAWTKELDRALSDMWKIAVARLGGLESRS
jgi:hypothetical protein